jgi:hypothetical protein
MTGATGLVGARVSTEGLSTIAVSDGSFIIMGLTEGSFSFTITAEGYRTTIETVSLHSGSNNHDFSLIPISIDPGRLNGPATFLVAPMSIESFSKIYPLGLISPPGHIFPANHSYFYFRDTEAVYDVFFPASGEIRSISNGPDYKITVLSSTTFTYYLGHVQSLEAVYAPYIGKNSIFGLPVFAGQKCGTTGKNIFNVHAMDLGVIDTDQELSFITPANYLSESTNCGAPLSYYAEPLKTTLYASVERDDLVNRDGKIDFDRPGKLIGNWFSAELEGEYPKESYSDKQIAFVCDGRLSTIEVVAIGGVITGEGLGCGLYAVSFEAARFEDVDQNTGVVTYVLHNFFNYPEIKGCLLVSYNSNNTITVEASNGPLSGFSEAARTFIR